MHLLTYLQLKNSKLELQSLFGSDPAKILGWIIAIKLYSDFIDIIVKYGKVNWHLLGVRKML